MARSVLTSDGSSLTPFVPMWTGAPDLAAAGASAVPVAFASGACLGSASADQAADDWTSNSPTDRVNRHERRVNTATPQNQSEIRQDEPNHRSTTTSERRARGSGSSKRRSRRR